MKQHYDIELITMKKAYQTAMAKKVYLMQKLKNYFRGISDDQAFNFEDGALMGLWRIKIPKKEIIKRL